MTNLSSDHSKEFDSKKNQPYIVPAHENFSEQYSEISEYQVRDVSLDKSENDDWDSAGDLVLFI